MATCNLSCLSLKPTIGGGLPSKEKAKAPGKYNIILKLGNTKRSSFRCNSCLPTAFKTEPEPVFTYVKAFAPATIANFGPGNLACALDGLGHYVSVRVDPEVHPGGVEVRKGGVLRNCSCVVVRGAALYVMRMLGIKSVGLSLCIEEEEGLGLGLGLGLPSFDGNNIGLLGSSAASAAAAAFAVNEIFGGKLSATDLILAGLLPSESNHYMSGENFPTNILAAIMGGFVHGCQPFYDTTHLTFTVSKKLFVILVIPELEFDEYEKLRTVGGAENNAAVTKRDIRQNYFRGIHMAISSFPGHLNDFGDAMSSDIIMEPRRAALVPGFVTVKKAALEAGALGCTISGAGPVVAISYDDEEIGKEIGSRMVEAFLNNGGLRASAMVRRVDWVGARVVFSSTSP